MTMLRKSSCLAFAKFVVFLTFLFVTGCRSNAASPEYDNGVKEVKTTISEGSIFDPVWDPTGEILVINNYFAPLSRIYLLDLKNSKTVLLYETGGTAIAKAWTPDGKLITAFIDTSQHEEGIWNIDPSGKETPVFVTTGHEASWSPAGTKLAILDNSTRKPSGQYTERLRIINTQNKTEDVVFEAQGEDLLATGLSWSANGKYIAFSLNVDHQGGQIYIFDVVTKTITNITDDKDDHWSPSWAPDSHLISYVSRSVGNFNNSLAVSTTDGKCKALVPEITDVWSVAWSPTEGELLFGWRNTKIFLLDLDSALKKGLLNEVFNCS